GLDGPVDHRLESAGRRIALQGLPGGGGPGAPPAGGAGWLDGEAPVPVDERAHRRGHAGTGFEAARGSDLGDQGREGGEAGINHGESIGDQAAARTRRLDIDAEVADSALPDRVDGD